MGDVFKYSTLASWISSLNTVRNNLSLTNYSDSSTAAGSVAKASAINSYLASINALRSNTYGAYGVYSISNPETIATNSVIDDDIVTKIDTTLADLKTICANDLSNLTSTSGFSLQNISTSFSRTSFTRTLVASNTNFADNSANNSNNTDFNPDFCTFNSANFAQFSDDFSADFCRTNFTNLLFDSTNFNKNTSFSTDNPFSSNFNTPNSDDSNDNDCNFCIDFNETCSNCTDRTRFSDFSDACSNNTNCVTNTNCQNFSDMTNFTPNQTCSNTCGVTGTINTLTALFAGFAVRT